METPADYNFRKLKRLRTWRDRDRAAMEEACRSLPDKTPSCPQEAIAMLAKERDELRAKLDCGAEPGKEAEELRSAIEQLIEQGDDCDEGITPRDLQDLLDSINARDSLAAADRWIAIGKRDAQETIQELRVKLELLENRRDNVTRNSEWLALHGDMSPSVARGHAWKSADAFGGYRIGMGWVTRDGLVHGIVNNPEEEAAVELSANVVPDMEFRANHTFLLDDARHAVGDQRLTIEPNGMLADGSAEDDGSWAPVVGGKALVEFARPTEQEALLAVVLGAP